MEITEHFQLFKPCAIYRYDARGGLELGYLDKYTR